jgi:hypothetical protein
MSGRIRSIKPEWLEDEALLNCSAEARVISIGLLLLADDHGNGRGSEIYLSSRIFPLAESTETLRNGVSELVKINFVELYRLNGQTYFSIRNWKKHQRVDKPGKPRVPGPLDKGVEKVPETFLGIPGVSRLIPTPIPTPIPTSYHDHDHDHLVVTASNEFETRSEIMTAAPTALAVAKRKGRSPEQQERSRQVNRRYRERYEQREGHPPTGMDQQANGIIARFSDKHAENAIAILDWFFDCPDTGFKRSGWALQLLFDQAPKLWRELNDKRKAVENLAAPTQQRIIARNASNDIELERANEILARELNR